MKGVIYCIECNDTGDKYIGSTITRLIERIWKHISDANLYERGKKEVVCTSYPIISNGNYKYYPLEELDINEKRELGIKERHFIENTKCVNYVIPTRSKYESDKAYYIKNIEAIDTRRKARVDCECGGHYKVNDKSKHLKSKKHQEYLKSN